MAVDLQRSLNTRHRLGRPILRIQRQAGQVERSSVPRRSREKLVVGGQRFVDPALTMKAQSTLQRRDVVHGKGNGSKTIGWRLVRSRKRVTVELRIIYIMSTAKYRRIGIQSLKTKRGQCIQHPIILPCGASLGDRDPRIPTS